MLYYKSSRILTWYEQYLPPARGSQEEWESGGGGAGMLRTRWSNWPFETDVSNKQPTREKTNTILCYLAQPMCEFTPLPTRCRPWPQWSTQQVALCHQSWPVPLMTSHLRSTFQCEFVTIVFVSLANCSRSWTSK